MSLKCIRMAFKVQEQHIQIARLEQETKKAKFDHRRKEYEEHVFE